GAPGPRPVRRGLPPAAPARPAQRGLRGRHGRHLPPPPGPHRTRPGRRPAGPRLPARPREGVRRGARTVRSGHPPPHPPDRQEARVTRTPLPDDRRAEKRRANLRRGAASLPGTTGRAPLNRDPGRPGEGGRSTALPGPTWPTHRTRAPRGTPWMTAADSPAPPRPS